MREFSLEANWVSPNDYCIPTRRVASVTRGGGRTNTEQQRLMVVAFLVVVEDAEG